MQTLIKTLTADNGQIYTVSSGQRTLLANCPVTVEVYELSQNIPALGVVGYKLKIHYNAEVHCNTIETTRSVDADFLKNITRFEIIADIQRQDGIFERLTFDSLKLISFDLHRMDFVFEVTDDKMTNKLLSF